MEGFWYVLNNYVWVPIVSAVIGGALSLGVPILWNTWQKKKRNAFERQIDEFSISGEWNSVFIEGKDIQTEQVMIQQVGRHVTANMKMGKREYKFEGEFKNQILVGAYESNSKTNDERGTIVLRYINENLLSGYCTFVYKNRQVYNSPYVLASVAHHKVDKGTYQFCNGCVGKFDCCCNCESIDMPILLPFEAKTIASITKKSIDSFAEKKTNNLYQMKRKDGDPKKECIFFQNSRCSIYNNRPVDCRMFPFDFKEIDGEYWVIYYNKVCNALPVDKDEIESCGYNIRPLLEIVMPYMSECSDPILSERLSKQEYIKLFSVNHIRDDG